VNIQKMIEELRAERDCLEEALVSLNKLALRRSPRRGRPPAWSKSSTVSTPKKETSSHESPKRQSSKSVLSIGNG